MATYFRNLLAMVRKPFYQAVPLFPSGQDLSWIPDAGTNLVTATPSETPDGVIVTFTFTSAPKFLVWNGQLLVAVTDFTVVGTQAVMAKAPATGDELYAII